MRRLRGGIYDRPDGRKLAQIQIRGKRISAVCNSEREAEEWLEAIRRTHAVEVDGVAHHHAVATLASIADDWFDAREKKGKRVDQERSSFDRYVKSHAIAHQPITSIDLPVLNRWVEEIELRKVRTTIRRAGKVETVEESRTISRQTAAHALRIVKGLCHHARKLGLITAEQAVDARSTNIERGRATDRTWTWLTQPEIDAILALEHGDAKRTTELRSIYAAAIYTGLRRSELWALTWDRVHLDGDDPRIEVRAPLKSPNALRDVPLLPPAIEALKAWKELSNAEPGRPVWPSATNGFRGDDDDAPGWRDHPYWTTGKNRRRVVTKGAVSRAGITRRVRFHDSRHTFCSQLVQGTWGRVWSLYEVMQVAGHSNISVTQRYAHLCPGGIKDAARLMRDQWNSRVATSTGTSTGPSDESANRPRK
jgi:integrase